LTNIFVNLVERWAERQPGRRDAPPKITSPAIPLRFVRFDASEMLDDRIFEVLRLSLTRARKRQLTGRSRELANSGSPHFSARFGLSLESFDRVVDRRTTF
jgi:hypothetical protein